MTEFKYNRQQQSNKTDEMIMKKDNRTTELYHIFLLTD